MGKVERVEGLLVSLEASDKRTPVEMAVMDRYVEAADADFWSES